MEFVLDVSYLRMFKESEEDCCWGDIKIRCDNDSALELAFLEEFLENFRKQPDCFNIKDSFLTPEKPQSRAATSTPLPQPTFELIAAEQLCEEEVRKQPCSQHSP